MKIKKLENELMARPIQKSISTFKNELQFGLSNPSIQFNYTYTLIFTQIVICMSGRYMSRVLMDWIA